MIKYFSIVSKVKMNQLIHGHPDSKLIITKAGELERHSDNQILILKR